jgi:hypothetical protein
MFRFDIDLARALELACSQIVEQVYRPLIRGYEVTILVPSKKPIAVKGIVKTIALFIFQENKI